MILRLYISVLTFITGFLLVYCIILNYRINGLCERESEALDREIEHVKIRSKSIEAIYLTAIHIENIYKIINQNKIE